MVAAINTTWIRSPLWDGFWVLSGAPLGLLLLGASNAIPAALLTFWLVVLLQQSHNFSPIVMAWGHRSFRAHMLQHKAKFILIPLSLLAGSLAVGWLSEMLYPSFFPFRGTKIDVIGPSGWQSPLGLMLALYFVWNTYHFAKQNFGVLSIYRARSGSGRRTADLVYALTVHLVVTAIGIAAMLHLGDARTIDMCMFGALAGVAAMLSLETKLSPRIPFILTDASRLILMSWSGLWGFAISGMNHWLVAIGLSSHVYANHQHRTPLTFSAVLVGLGMLVFGLLFVVVPFTGIHSTSGPAPLPWWIRATIPAVSLRLGLGFVHFLYDRWLWRFGDPQVRETIGADLFRKRMAFPVEPQAKCFRRRSEDWR
jgi:hypothetical protein